MTNYTNTIPDAQQREEALNPSISFIVQAPAGSGKTELLMQRFLRLLAIVKRPEEILAITFTRKAAGEMQARIMQALMKAKKEPLESAKPHEKKSYELARMALKRDSEMGWNLLENPGRLKVQTIDSLCSSLTRQMPLLSHLGKQPSITETPEEFYRDAARRTIVMVEEDGETGEAARQALRHLDNSIQSLEDRLVIMLQKRDQWLRHVKRGDEEFRELLEGSVRNLVEDTLIKARESFPERIINDLTASARYAASNILKEGKDSPINRLADPYCLPDASAESLPIWQGIAELLLTKDGEWRKPRGIDKRQGFPADKTDEAMRCKELFQSILNDLSDNEQLLAALAAIPFLPKPRYDEDEWKILNALLHLLPVAESHLKQVFGEKGGVDFQAVSMAALDALGTDEAPTDLMLAMDYRMQHILVDEFQDTSRAQLELVRALTRGWEPGDGRTLFVVGDPMQSIYLFREAVVGLFLDARKYGIGNVMLTPLTLTSNFRSQQGIVDWVNESFVGSFPDVEDSLTGAISYTPSKAIHPPLDAVSVEARIFGKRDNVREAEEIAEIIKGIDMDRESIAILVRSRPHLGEIIKTLKKEGIGFKSEDIDPLIERPVIQDLFSLLRALMHPYDRIAWLAILRAPWCGMTLDDLHRLCLGDRDAPVWSLISSNCSPPHPHPNPPLEREGAINRLSDDGQRRLSVITEKFRNALKMWGRISARSLLEGLWIELGGPACVDDSSTSMKDAEGFFDMLGSVSSNGEISIESLESRIKGLYASQAAHSKQVEIMTIHKAKGLEFDHVILPGLGKTTRGGNKKILLWMEKGDDIVLAPVESKGGSTESAIYKYLESVDSSKEMYERTRLLYVAATRARKRLFLFGDATIKKSGEVSVKSNSLLSSLSHIVTPEMLIVGGNNVTATSETGKTILMLKRLESSWELPEASRPVQLEVRGVDAASISMEPEFNWAGEAIKHLGTVVHRYLRHIADEGLLKWDKERVVLEKSRMKSMLCQLGLNKGDVEKAAEKGVEMICRMLCDGHGRWILEGHPEASSELSLTGVIDGKVIHAVIDRTFVDENGIRWIIDYKTSLHEGGEIERFLEIEKERYRKQLETYAAIIANGGEKRMIKKGLYYPAVPAFLEV